MYLLILGQGPKDLFYFRMIHYIFHSLMIRTGFSLLSVAVLKLCPHLIYSTSPQELSPRRKRKQTDEDDSSPLAKRSIVNPLIQDSRLPMLLSSSLHLASIAAAFYTYEPGQHLCHGREIPPKTICTLVMVVKLYLARLAHSASWLMCRGALLINITIINKIQMYFCGT